MASPVIETLHTLPPHEDDIPEKAPELTGWARHLLPAQPVVEHVDCIISQLGAKAQGFHPDAGDTHIKLARLNARHRLFNVFCPLTDLQEDGDGTMFWPRVAPSLRGGPLRTRRSSALARSRPTRWR